MTKTFIKNNGAFPLSKAVLHDEKYTMELSGQIGMNSETGKLAEGIEKQTIQTLENINNILNSVKWNLSNIIKVRIYLSDMENYAKMNEIYSRYFKKDHPARVALAVKELPSKALIEIECVACGDKINN